MAIKCLKNLIFLTLFHFLHFMCFLLEKRRFCNTSQAKTSFFYLPSVLKPQGQRQPASQSTNESGVPPRVQKSTFLNGVLNPLLVELFPRSWPLLGTLWARIWTKNRPKWDPKPYLLTGQTSILLSIFTNFTGSRPQKLCSY